MKKFLVFLFLISSIVFGAGMGFSGMGTTVMGGGGGGTPSGNDTWVQFNDNGSFGASNDFTFDKSTGTLTQFGAHNFYKDYANITYSSLLGNNILGYGVAGVGGLAQLDNNDIVINAVFDATPFGGSFMSGSYFMDSDGGQAASIVRRQNVTFSASDGATWASQFSLGKVVDLDISGTGNYFKIKTDSGDFKFNQASLLLPANTADAPIFHFEEGINLNSPQKGDMWWNGSELIFNNGAQNIDLLGGTGGDKDYIWSNTEAFSVFLNNSGLRTKINSNSELVNVYLYDAMSTGIWTLDEGYQYAHRIRLIGASTKASSSVVKIINGACSGTFFEQIENIMFVNQNNMNISFAISDGLHIRPKNVIFISNNNTNDAQPMFFITGQDFSIIGDFTFLRGDNPVMVIQNGYTGSLEIELGDGEIQSNTISGGNALIPNGVTGLLQPYTVGSIYFQFKFEPTSGTFDLEWDGVGVTGLAYDISEADLQTAIRTITGLEDITVVKDGYNFSVKMNNVDIPLVHGFVITDNTNGVLSNGLQTAGNWQTYRLESLPPVTGGSYDITLPGNTATLSWNDDETTIQNAVRVLAGNPNLTVSGTMDATGGIIITAVDFHGDYSWGLDLASATTTASQLTLTAYSPNAEISLVQTSYLGNINKNESGKAENLEMNAYKMLTTIDDATVVNTTDETSMIVAGVGKTEILGNTLKVGDVIRIKATGIINTTGTPDGTIRIYMGSTLVATSTVTLTALDDNYFEAELDIVVRTITSLTETGSVYASGKTMVQSPIGFNNMVGRAIYTATDIEVDTTQNITLDATYQFSVPSEDNYITVRSFIIERL